MDFRRTFSFACSTTTAALNRDRRLFLCYFNENGIVFWLSMVNVAQMSSTRNPRRSLQWTECRFNQNMQSNDDFAHHELVVIPFCASANRISHQRWFQCSPVLSSQLSCELMIKTIQKCVVSRVWHQPMSNHMPFVWFSYRLICPKGFPVATQSDDGRGNVQHTLTPLAIGCVTRSSFPFNYRLA